MDLKKASIPIAVIGMGCRYPGADSPTTLWMNILSRRRQFRRMPACRLPLADYYDPDRKAEDKTYARMAAVIDGFSFDWAARRIPRLTYLNTDIVHWLALETALQAITDAGFTRETIPGQRTGVIVGNSLTGEQSRSSNLRLRWPYVRKALLQTARRRNLAPEEIEALEQDMENVFKSAFPPVNEDALAGGLSNTIAGRICNYLNLDGGGYTVDGACSSSLLAIATAATGLSTGVLDLALAGGVDISLDPFEMVGFSKTGALTAGEMTVYDRRANGFIPGEGCGFVVLKRYTDAKRDHDTIYAVIQGWGISSDGANAAITAPSVPGQSTALRRAYEHTDYGPEHLHFIEGHGTGTTVGDRVELEAIAAVQHERFLGRPGSGRICGITSLKSLVGHTKAASGVGGFIKAVIAVNRRICPPTANCRFPNPAFEDAARLLFPVQIGRCLPPAQTIRAGVSAMGFGGINSHVTLESFGHPSTKFEGSIDERALMVSAQETELFVLSADSGADLISACRKLGKAAEGISYAEMTDLAASLGHQSDPMKPIRAAIIAGDPDALAEKIAKLKTIIENQPPTPGKTDHDPQARIWLGWPDGQPRVGFLFPGQGSQKLNMGRVLVERFQWARDLVAQADDLSAKHGDVRLSQIMFPPIDQAPDQDQVATWFQALSLTTNSQPAICLASLLWLRFLTDLGVVPTASGGHSLGEVSAFHAAGAFDEDTLLRFAFHRGRAMSGEQEDRGGMLSLQCTRAEAEALLARVDHGYAALANINAPRQMVVAGASQAIAQLRGLAESEGVGVRALPVSNAFHCRLTLPAAETLSRQPILPDSLPAPALRLFSSVTGQEIAPGIDLQQHFVRQITSQVDFVAMVENLARCSDVLIEVGPGRVLCSLVDAILPSGKTPCLPVESSPMQSDDLNHLLALLYVKGQAIHWDRLYSNRLVYPFMPTADRVFIANPCEHLPADQFASAAPSIDQSVDNRQAAMLPFDLPGLPQETLRLYLRRRGSFLSEFIRVDMKHALPEHGPEENQPVRPAAFEAASTRVGATPDPPYNPPDLETLLAMVEAATGFPGETLTRDARLLDDLNLDSIKSGDLIARYLEKFGLAGEIDTARWTNASLGEIVDLVADRLAHRPLRAGREQRLSPADVLQMLMEHIGAATGMNAADLSDQARLGPDLQVDQEHLHEILRSISKKLKLDLNLDLQPLIYRTPAQIAGIFSRMINAGKITDPLSTIKLPQTAVREMRIDIIESERPELPAWYGKRAEDQWPNARVLIIGDKVHDIVCQAILKQLTRAGARARVASFAMLQNGAVQGAMEAFSHFVAVLPRMAVESMLTEKRLLRIIRRLSFAAVPPPASHAPRRRNCLAFVQFGGGYFGTHSDAVFLDQCCATALAKSVYLEREDLKMRVIDFDPRTDTALIAQKVISEIQGPENFVEVGYDRHLTRRTTVANAIEPAQYTPDPLSWSDQDVILVTGGAKGITAQCALALAWAVGAKMALIGRTPVAGLKPEAQSGKAINDILQQYAAQGLTARYYSCDVCDRNAVARTVRRIQNEMGTITGVIHGAGRNTPRRFHDVSPEEVLKEIGPKVIGMLNLLAELKRKPPKLIVGLTSIIGITGMQGNGWYAFSNEALDLILRRSASSFPGTRTLSVAYSIWRDEGMGARMGSVRALEKKGIDSIPTDEGVSRFVRLFLSNPGTHQVLVAARIMQMDTLGTPATEPLKGARFLEKRIHFIPGVESAFLVHLSTDEDLYLLDHSFNGSYLFPTVFGLEAMAQAVASVAGMAGLRGVRIEDIRLKRPIVVDPEKGSDIIIWAQTQEKLSVDDKLTVKAGIFKAGADLNDESFSAIFVLGAMDQPKDRQLDFPSDSLDLVPSTDLYRRTLLFQGPRFQRIEKVHQLVRYDDDTGTVVVATPTPDPDSTAIAFAKPDGLFFILGDPFQRDNLLQSAALLIPQDTSLPVSIRSWEVYPQDCALPEKDRIFIRTRLRGIRDQEVETAVEALDASGVPTERLTGYRLKILKHHDDYPSVADLLLPDDRDTRLVRDRLDNRCAALHLKAPNIFISFMPGLHDLAREQRRRMEQSLLQKAAEDWALSTHTDPSRITVHWQPTGKPVVTACDVPLHISLAHDNHYCLVAVGPSTVGCDLAPITHRTASQWAGLLGPLARKMIDGQPTGDELDRRGTAIWAAREVLNKMGIRELISIQPESTADDSILFNCTTDKGIIRVLTFELAMTRGRKRMAAFSVTDAPVQRIEVTNEEIAYPGYETLLSGQQYKIIEGGPQGQTVFIRRFPVTFMPAGQLSRNVYYSHYFFWAGEVRETSAWPVLDKITDQFSTGKWGGVTNYANLKIMGEATTHDLIEARLWASGNGGPQNSVLDLTFDFRKVLPGGGFERLAWLEQQTTWVRILDHGAAKVEPYPDYYGAFLEQMLPRYDAPNTPEPITEPLTALHRNGAEGDHYQAPVGPTVKPILHTQCMETSLEEANIVGNIYFANYYAWQGRVRDHYFYSLIPDYYRGTGEQGEVICLNCRVDHLREAMPFDRIEVRMALKACNECRAQLHFEYFKWGSSGPPLKLATGNQEIVWVRRDSSKRPVLQPFPPAITRALQTAIDQQT